MLTSHADVSSAVRSLKAGAMDFLDKPFAPQQLIDLVPSCGWHAVPCESAEAFVDVHSPGKGQCLVLDHRLTGVQLQRRLREQNDHVPVIMVTAHRGLPEADKAYLYGAYAVLGKPVDGTELEGWIRRALASH
jgi:FixJ family two-component response regulator